MRKYEEQLDRLITHKLREVAESGSVSTAYTTGFEYDVADEIIRTMDQSAQMAALEHLLFEKIGVQNRSGRRPGRPERPLPARAPPRIPPNRPASVPRADPDRHRLDPHA